MISSFLLFTLSSLLSVRSRTIFLLFVVSLFSLVVSCGTTPYKSFPGSGPAVASWYGAEFHGRPTASGERFDMHALTCAHREYPFGSVIQVTSRATEKSVTCVVNDRGPFVPGRDIDLSYAAAREIGLIGTGTGPVRIDYLGRDSRYVREVASRDARGPFTVQVGSFREIDNAQRLKMGLDLKYDGVYVSETTLEEAVYYRVRVGKFQRRSDAYTTAKMLAEEGYPAIIMTHDERI